MSLSGNCDPVGVYYIFCVFKQIYPQYDIIEVVRLNNLKFYDETGNNNDNNNDRNCF